ncbi:hypothetical protein D3C84_1268460 [compost metagenome]
MRPTDGQRHAMHHQRITLGDGVKVVKGFAALHHEVFGDDFEPVHGRRLIKNLLVVSTAQTQAVA